MIGTERTLHREGGNQVMTRKSTSGVFRLGRARREASDSHRGRASLSSQILRAGKGLREIYDNRLHSRALSLPGLAYVLGRLQSGSLCLGTTCSGSAVRKVFPHGFTTCFLLHFSLRAQLPLGATNMLTITLPIDIFQIKKRSRASG